MIHPDMAWPFAPNADAHDPIEWVFMMARFEEEQWRKDYQALFASHDLVHHHRRTVKIEVAPTEDGAFAVVDIDTFWRNRETGQRLPLERPRMQDLLEAALRRLEILLADQCAQLPAASWRFPEFARYIIAKRQPVPSTSR